MAVFGPFFFSALGVCEGGGHPLPCLAGKQKRPADAQVQDADPYDAARAACGRSGGRQQLKHCDHHTGDRGRAHLCGKPEVLTVYLDGERGSGFYGSVPRHGELPSGEDRDLAASGKI